MTLSEEEMIKKYIESVYRKAPIAYNPNYLISGKQRLVQCVCDRQYIVLTSTDENQSQSVEDIKYPFCFRDYSEHISISIHSAGFFNAISMRTNP